MIRSALGHLSRLLIGMGFILLILVALVYGWAVLKSQPDPDVARIVAGATILAAFATVLLAMATFLAVQEAVRQAAIAQDALDAAQEAVDAANRQADASNRQVQQSGKAVAAAEAANRQARDLAAIGSAPIFVFERPIVPIAGQLSVTIDVLNIGPSHALDVRMTLAHEAASGTFLPTQARMVAEPVLAVGQNKELSVNVLDVAQTPAPAEEPDYPENRLVPARYLITIVCRTTMGARVSESWLWDVRRDHRALRFFSLVIDPGTGSEPLRISASETST